MPKTDPEIITLGAVGTATVTAPSTLDGATVQSIEGGTVTRAGSALAGGETLHAGETLTFTPTTAGGTTYLNVRVDNAEFSGHYDDLDGKPDGTGATGPAGRGIATITVSGGHLTGTYSDGTSWDAGALPAGSGGGLDAEAVQDIVGQMLGETQGHYDDAAGTYTINLPAGSSMTDEQVQDIVGALVKAGANTTVAYDDAAGTLTISAVSGGGSTTAPVYLSTIAPYAQADNTNEVFTFGSSDTGDLILRLTTTTSGTLAYLGAQVKPTAAGQMTLTGKRNNTTFVTVDNSAPDGGDWAHFEFSGLNYQVGDVLDFTVQFKVNGLAGRRKTDAKPASVGPFTINTMTYGTLTTRGWGLRVGTSKTAVPKNVMGPLDPLDFPVVTAVGEIPNGGGARLRNTNKFYIRRDDGQLLEFTGSPVSG